MRESNFTFASHNRACVCISSTLYDRRALDAPAASLPLVNSLTHLSYLTATSARIRESLSCDGGLERLVRILQNCANPTAASTALVDVKGKGPLLPKRKARKSPFKAFADYDLLPSLDELRDLEEADATGALLSLLPDGGQQGYSYSIPPSLLLPPSLKPRHLLYTYTLAFQCVVNIGVRGSESIRTRVVEAGALEVVVHVLERYLEEIERKRARNQAEWHRAEQARLAQNGDTAMEVEPVESRRQREENDLLSGVPVDEAAERTRMMLVTAAPRPTRPLLTRMNIVAASSSAAADVLVPPSRVQTPDTVLSIDDASLTGDDNGSSSGQENEELTMTAASSEAENGQAQTRISVKAEGSGGASGQGSSGSTDEAGDVVMDVDANESERRTATVQEGERDTVDESSGRHPTPRGPHSRLPSGSSQPTPRAPVERAHQPRVPARAPTSFTAPTLESTPEPEGQLYFRDEDVLLALQLLAYLSKYPHVREVFHCPSTSAGDSESDEPCSHSQTAPKPSTAFASTQHPLIRPHSINIFSLVELFTQRPSSDDPFTPRLSHEVQYWACTIMRNACRKDEQRGGIRQCANMNCGKWEEYAREFAKCRRCRRAKYCSKACQSASWGNGHKFWCHKQSADDRSSRRRGPEAEAAADGASVASPSGPADPTGAAESRRRRHRRTAGGQEEDEDDEDELPPPPTATLSNHGPVHGTPAAPRIQGPTARHRSGTIPANPADGEPGAHPARQHPVAAGLAQPTPLLGLGPDGGQFDPGALPGMPLGIDEDRVAREMMLMGEEEGVRVQDA